MLLRGRPQVGEGGRVAALSLWDDSPRPWWSQLRRRLRDDPEVWSALCAEFGRHPATAASLTGLRPYRPERPSDSTWFTGTWLPWNTEVLVKVNVTERERFWMSAASQATTDVVPPVPASDTRLNELDVAWLVLERIPHGHDPAWGAPAFSALLQAAARFQVFAAGVETALVYEEGLDVIRRWARGGRDLCQEATVLLANVDRDWAWVTAVAQTEVMFGDLHFGNAAFRHPPPRLEAILFDPIPRRQPWPFEPAYCEVACGGSGLVREMAAIRAAGNRPTCGPGEVDRLAALYCGWIALLWWGIQPHLRSDAARRARLMKYVTSAAQLDR